MTPIHKVLSWSLGGQGGILIEVGMFRIPVLIVGTTFVKRLSPQNISFPVKMTPVHKVWSWSLGGHGIIQTGVRIQNVILDHSEMVRIDTEWV